ncbi:MAG: ribokinase [Lentisphaerae bacterium]|nr:ribokinase [Lentisphaerota bacterium]
MKILNFGSLNIDHVYNVKTFVKPGETIAALNYSRFPGGKGLNQSIALARAGAPVSHAGKIGADGVFLRDILIQAGVNCSLLLFAENEPTGHAVIQVSAEGENCIVLFGGANRTITSEQISSTFHSSEPGDFLLLQNEISGMSEIIRCAAAKKMRIFLNPAPMNESVYELPLDLIDTFIVNETEASGLAGTPENSEPELILKSLGRKYPSSNVLMTLGAAGAMYLDKNGGNFVFVPASRVEKVEDTTAAGDTFIGYFLAETALGKSAEEAMKTAAKASAICVSRPGAAVSIPFRNEL